MASFDESGSEPGAAMAQGEELFEFAAEPVAAEPWNVLIVDDEPAVHEVTRLVLGSFRFEDRPLKFHHAYSAAEARNLLRTVPDIGVMLLDVVMESDQAGLEKSMCDIALMPGVLRVDVRDSAGLALLSVRALADGSITDEVMKTLEGTAAPRDIVVTNGPMLAITSGGMAAIGRQVAAASGTVSFEVTVTAPTWADIDTLEVFANAAPSTPVPDGMSTAIVPLGCWTSRALASLAANDPCTLAALAPQAMTVQAVAVPGPGNARLLRATVTVTIDVADIPRMTGATGTDAWLVFRARGAKAIFPLLQGDLINDTTLPILVTGNQTQVDAVLAAGGVSAAAFAAPVFVDFDGGGYRAPFAP